MTNIINLIPFAKPVGDHFLVVVIDWLVGISSVAVGIILFTLILKLITLPFDFMSRASMRKNSLKMEEMRPELEKLQKQYANDKVKYNQKMMALYKKNGYSMWGACLPTIITLVIFIIAMRGFTVYSQFQMKEVFYDMSVSYNNVIYSGMETDDSYITKNENGELIFNAETLLTGDTRVIDLPAPYSHDIFVTKTETGYLVKTTNSFVQYNFMGESKEISIIKDKLVNNAVLASESNNMLKDDNGNAFSGTTDAQAVEFIRGICQTQSAKTYRNKNLNFLWVKNIWEIDSPLSHPVQENWDNFKNAQGYATNDTLGMNDKAYGELIAKLDAEKSAPNGYFILAILTAGISFLTQFVITKSQKAQMELQTVDGKGAQTQKMMMWMMPIMMAVFAFMYTATFSIYMIMSSVISILSTLAINKIVDVKYKKKNAPEDGKPEVIRGRVYTPKVEPVVEQPKKVKKTKEEKKAEKQALKQAKANKGDFMGNDVPKKHIRGRLK